MSTLMINDETTLFQEADFPENYIDKHHPDDYINITEPIHEFIYHHRPDHNRLIVRTCFKLSKHNYIPVSFVCDTGAPSYIYINELTRRLIKSRILTDDIGNEFIKIADKNLLLKSSPTNHPDTNIIGLKCLSFFGLFLNGNEFGFTNFPKHF